MVNQKKAELSNHNVGGYYHASQLINEIHSAHSKIIDSIHDANFIIMWFAGSRSTGAPLLRSLVASVEFLVFECVRDYAPKILIAESQ